MFTGIIEEIGKIKNIRRGQRSCVLVVEGSKVLDGTEEGDSIAVNSVCLTVTSMGSSYFTADVMAETMNRSSLGRLTQGTQVNLERAMAADGRFGGHIVSGHIDGTGTISGIVRDDNAIWYTVNAGREILRYVVEKGSIAIDGISLTVAQVDDEGLKVSIIPHTQDGTNLSAHRVGDEVNLECDIIGKYVEKLLREGPMGAGGGCQEGISAAPQREKITWEFLSEHGFG